MKVPRMIPKKMRKGQNMVNEKGRTCGCDVAGVRRGPSGTGVWIRPFDDEAAGLGAVMQVSLALPCPLHAL